LSSLSSFLSSPNLDISELLSETGDPSFNPYSPPCPPSFLLLISLSELLSETGDPLLQPTFSSLSFFFSSPDLVISELLSETGDPLLQPTFSSLSSFLSAPDLVK